MPTEIGIAYVRIVTAHRGGSFKHGKAGGVGGKPLELLHILPSRRTIESQSASLRAYQ
jgi:hypothetical protein